MFVIGVMNGFIVERKKKYETDFYVIKKHDF